MVGAVGVALGIEYDRSGIFTFLVPGVVGIIILFASWVSKKKKTVQTIPMQEKLSLTMSANLDNYGF